MAHAITFSETVKHNFFGEMLHTHSTVPHVGTAISFLVPRNQTLAIPELMSKWNETLLGTVSVLNRTSSQLCIYSKCT